MGLPPRAVATCSAKRQKTVHCHRGMFGQMVRLIHWLSGLTNGEAMVK